MGKKVCLSYKDYLASDVWKCPMAPINPDIELQVANNTGAHYWWELRVGKLRGRFCCAYCYDVKEFATNYSYAVNQLP